MSSAEVRQLINAKVAELAAPWPVHDLSDYADISDLLNEVTSEVVLIQYTASVDDMQTIGGEGNQGWEETGTVVIHIVVPTGFSSLPVIQKGDAIRVGMRGSRLSAKVLVESFAPFVDFSGNSIGVEGAWHGFAAPLFYSRRDCG